MINFNLNKTNLEDINFCLNRIEDSLKPQSKYQKAYSLLKSMVITPAPSPAPAIALTQSIVELKSSLFIENQEVGAANATEQESLIDVESQQSDLLNRIKNVADQIHIKMDKTAPEEKNSYQRLLEELEGMKEKLIRGIESPENFLTRIAPPRFEKDSEEFKLEILQNLILPSLKKTIEYEEKYHNSEGACIGSDTFTICDLFYGDAIDRYLNISINGETVEKETPILKLFLDNGLTKAEITEISKILNQTTNAAYIESIYKEAYASYAEEINKSDQWYGFSLNTNGTSNYSLIVNSQFIIFEYKDVLQASVVKDVELKGIGYLGTSLKVIFNKEKFKHFATLSSDQKIELFKTFNQEKAKLELKKELEDFIKIGEDETNETNLIENVQDLNEISMDIFNFFKTEEIFSGFMKDMQEVEKYLKMAKLQNQ